MMTNPSPTYVNVTLQGPLMLDSWTTATRPTTPLAGATGLNTDLDQTETWDGSAWSTKVVSVVGANGAVTLAELVTGGVAPLASPALTGNPTAPTPATSDNDTSIATTAYVTAKVASVTSGVSTINGRSGAVTLALSDIPGAAPLASPTFTGSPVAPTPSTDDNDTSLATTAFVLGQLSAAPPVMDGSATVGVSTRIARADHVHPTDTSRYAASNPSGYQTASQVTAVLPTASTVLPSMDAAASVGIGTTWARADHIHPSDISRAPIASPTFTGTPIIPYQAPYSGAAARTYGAKVGDIPSILDFSGVDPTGATDSATGLLYAIAAVGARRLRWPAGTYTTSQQILVTTNGQVWEGDGSAATYLRASAGFTGGDMVVFGDGTNNIIRCGIHDIALDTVSPRTSGAALRVRAGSNFQSRGLVIGPFGGRHFDGISIESTGANQTFQVSFRDFEIRNCVNRGMRLGDFGSGTTYGGGDVFLDGGLVLGCGSGGILLSNIQGIEFSKMDVLANAGFGILIDPLFASGQTVCFAFFTNITADSSTSTPGYGWGFAGSGIVADISLTNCWGGSNVTDGFAFVGTSMNGISLVNCISEFNGNHGYNVTKTCNASFSTCRAHNNSTSSDSTYHGFNFAAAVDGFQVMNCFSGQGGFEGASGITNHQGYGFCVQSGASDIYNIIGNRSVSNRLGTIFDGGTGTTKNVALNLIS